jgi:hypothetical protein
VGHEITLVFVYNANSGVFNTLTDVAHKIFSPATYACNLCALTHTHFGMRREWQDFTASLNTPVEFLHADEFKAKYHVADVALPAVFQKEDGQLQVWLDSSAINSCQTLAELKQLLASRALQAEA